MAIFMNTRRSGSMTGHVTAQLEALTHEALIGSGNYVFEIGNKLAITVTPGVGTVSVSSGVFSWCGRLGGVDSPESVSYTAPDSETLFKKIVVCAKYSKDGATSLESISLVTFESEIQASESAATSLSVDTGNADITSATETAYLPLWEFVATSTSNTVPLQLFETVSSISDLLVSVVSLNKKLESEIEKRDEIDAVIQRSLSTLEKSVTLIADNITGNNLEITLSGYTGFICMIETGFNSGKLTPFFVPAKEGNYYRTSYKFTERTMGGFNVSVYNPYINVQTNRISYLGYVFSSDNDIGCLKAVYGIR